MNKIKYLIDFSLYWLQTNIGSIVRSITPVEVVNFPDDQKVVILQNWKNGFGQKSEILNFPCNFWQGAEKPGQSGLNDFPGG